VRDVLPQSPAAEAGLQKRDVILSCEGVGVSSSAALVDAVGRKRPDETVTLMIRRDDVEREVQVQLSAVPDVVPEMLTTSVIPAPVEGAVPAEKLGRASATLPGDGAANYWRYVPQQYNPAHAYGLLVWLHPAGDTMEAAVFKAWQQHCDRRGMILVAPKAADLSGWTAGETEVVRELVEQVQRDYTIDPQRISVHGFAEGGRFAWDVAFKYRDLFRGVITASAPLREAPPDNDPDFRVQMCVVGGANDPRRGRIEKSVEVLRDAKFPTRLIVVEETAADYPPESTVEELARWLDVLDRI
ncbi:MAG: PDZ domain-containing protein, partial [Planctomycetaceae bacterium]|nr:PDZ domain-containing protein [Planctomycetaceae bacterium]